MDWRWPLISAYFHWRGEAVPRLYAEACARQWQSADGLRAFQQQRLDALLQHAVAACPAHRGRNASLDHFPVLTKEGLRDGFRQLAAEGSALRGWLQHSGGSTGEPSTVRLDSAMHAWRIACGWRGDCWGGLKPTDRFAFLWGHPGDLSGSARLRERLHAWLFNRWLSDVFALDDPRVREIHAWIHAKRPACLVGYASALLSYARLARVQGLRPPPLRKVVATAETCSAEDAAEIAAYFAAPVLQRYGAREVGDIAHQCEQGAWHVHSDHVLLEVRRDDGSISSDGEGSLLVTCLSNYSMPLIRYEIGDRADLTPQPCPCGRGLPTFTALLGRVSDYIDLADGGRLSSLVFNHLLRSAPIRQFQVVQSAPGRIRLRILPLADFTEAALVPLQRYLAANCGGRLALALELVEDIETSPSGKLRQVVREPEQQGPGQPALG
jgi:phenylacetate-CoA ligase